MWRLISAKLVFLGVAAATMAAAPLVSAAEPVAASARASQETLDATTLRAIFTLRKRRWSDGQPIRVFVLRDDSPAHQAFVKQKLRMFPYQLRQQWDRVVFSGTGAAPQDFDDQESMLRSLASTPNAIGYADVDELPEGVAVIGMKP